MGVPMPTRDEELALLLLETVPAFMAEIRDQMQAQGGPDLTLVQFRALRHVGRHEGITMGELAEHLAVGRPAASKIVQALVERGWIEREPSAEDRRQVALRLGPAAKAGWKRMRELARGRIAQRLAPLTTTERASLEAGLRALQRLLAREGGA
jgi:DNA-binding MarR family transcriptional regulator